MVVGGFLAVGSVALRADRRRRLRRRRRVALTIGFAPLAPMAVPVLFGVMGFAAGIAGPSRDLIVKRAAPENATGRVYGVVYSGLDIGQAFVPLVFGPLMDMHGRRRLARHRHRAGVLIANAFNVRRARRTALAPAPA